MAGRRQAYVYGNTARREEVYRPGHYRDSEARKNEEIRRNREEALRMDLPFLVLLTIAAVAALIICCNYIQVQSSITTSIKNIEAQERVLEKLKNENDALETRINSSVNLDYVYDVATNELGMVFARQNQVLLYDKTESEYVRQYDDIPQ